MPAHVRASHPARRSTRAGSGRFGAMSDLQRRAVSSVAPLIASSRRPPRRPPGLLARLQDNRNALGLLFMVPARPAAAALPHLSARARHLARLHRHEDRPRRPLRSASRTSSSCGTTQSRGSRCSTRCSTRWSPASSSSRWACGSRCCSTSTCRSRRCSARSCCCPSSCPPRCRRSRSGGSTTRSSRSSAGRSLKMGWINQYIDFLGQPVARALRHHRRQHLARRAVRRDHAARRAADHLAVVLRGREPRRRDRLAQVPLRDAAAAHADHRRRDDVLGALHVHRLPAHLRADARRAAQRDAPHGHAVVPARDLGRQPGRGRRHRHRDGAVPDRARSCSAISVCSGGAWQQGGTDK